eukprot:3866661-Rhodomonas_salina.1
MSGTEPAYAANINAWGSGTDVAYCATRRRASITGQGQGGSATRWLSAYARTTPCPVLTYRMVLSAYAPATPCP